MDVDLSRILDQFTESLTSQVAREIVVSAHHEIRGTQNADAYLAGVTVQREGPDVVLRVTGLIPNFIEHGLGPAGIGSEGPFDLRASVLKGKERQAIPVAPGQFRMLTLKGKPWIHPGFKRMALVPKLQASMKHVVADAIGWRWPRFTSAGDDSWKQRPSYPSNLTGVA